MSSREEDGSWMTFRQGMGIVAVVCVLLLATLAGKIVENVNADEIVVIQSVGGNLAWYTTPGPKLQMFGKVTRYKKRSIYKFEKRVRFNDGGHATMVGSIQYDLPLDDEHLNLIHSKFGSQEGVQDQLVATVVDKCTYMTGPTMSSKESYAEKRNLLIWYVEDQVTNGVYRTQQKKRTIKAPITEVEKTVTVTDILVNPETNLPERIEQPVLTQFSVKPFNFTITDLNYEPIIEKQIEAQQQATMDVQIAIAEAKKADQRKLTAEAEGAAAAAKAKWEQETIKAREVTKAEQDKAVAELGAKQKLTVAELGTQEAEQYKRTLILKADGDAQYKQRVMQADGALTQKLEALIEINGKYADAIEKHPGAWVPNIVMGGNSTGAQNAAGSIGSLIELLTAQTAKNLSLDMSLPQQKQN